MPIGAAGLEIPGFVRVSQQEDRTSASYWRENKSANTALFSRSEKEAVRVVTTANVSPILFHKIALFQSMGALQMSLYSWYPLTILNIVNACTIFRGTRDVEINDCGLFKFSVAHCN